jgi:hypothetical protein
MFSRFYRCFLCFFSRYCHISMEFFLFWRFLVCSIGKGELLHSRFRWLKMENCSRRSQDGVSFFLLVSQKPYSIFETLMIQMLDLFLAVTAVINVDAIN